MKKKKKIVKKERQVEEPVQEVVVVEETVSIAKRPVFSKWPVIAILLLVVLGIGGYLYYTKVYVASNDPRQMTKEQVTSLAAQVGRLIVLPNDEIPTIATVVDTKELAGQPFFTHAQNGDKVLIYNTSNKAYLYRPSIDKIVEVGPLKKTENAALSQKQTTVLGKSVAPATNTNEPVKVAIYNGTRITGLAGDTQLFLETEIKNIRVTQKQNAKKRDYSTTVVVDVKGRPQVAQEISKLIRGQLVSMPENEATPSADVLVILGNDQ